MRISDWSSDVCSSDLAAKRAGADVETAAVEPHHRDAEALAFGADQILRRPADRIQHHLRGRLRMPAELAFLRAAADASLEEHTSELQSLMRISYAVFCLKKKNTNSPKRRVKLLTCHTTRYY